VKEKSSRFEARASNLELADRALIGPLGLALAILVFLTLALPGLRKPFVYDEVSFAQGAEAVAQTGRPYADFGYMIDRGRTDQRFQFALWHPPLYIFTLGAAFRLAHVSEGVARGLGLALALVSAVLIYASVLRLLRGRAQADGAAALAAFLYLVNPLVIQSALLLDIDGTVLTLFVAAFIAAYVHLEGRPERRRLGLLALLFAIGLWAKLTTPWGLLVALAATHLLRRNWRRVLRETLVIGGGGALLFLATWALLCVALRLPFAMPFNVLWAELRDALGGGGTDLGSPLRFGRAIGAVVWWASPYLAGLFLGVTLLRIIAFARRREVAPTDWLLIFGLGVFFV
jgi:4-amino-4-deoxy-L-arabinose transferase-like glycosyltransferase